MHFQEKDIFINTRLRFCPYVSEIGIFKSKMLVTMMLFLMSFFIGSSQTHSPPKSNFIFFGEIHENKGNIDQIRIIKDLNDSSLKSIVVECQPSFIYVMNYCSKSKNDSLFHWYLNLFNSRKSRKKVLKGIYQFSKDNPQIKIYGVDTEVDYFFSLYKHQPNELKVFNLRINY